MNQHKHPDNGCLRDGRARGAPTGRGFQALHSERTEMNCLSDRRERSDQPVIGLAGTLVERYRIIHHHRATEPPFGTMRLGRLGRAQAGPVSTGTQRRLFLPGGRSQASGPELEHRCDAPGRVRGIVCRDKAGIRFDREASGGDYEAS